MASIFNVGIPTVVPIGTMALANTFPGTCQVFSKSEQCQARLLELFICQLVSQLNVYSALPASGPRVDYNTVLKQ